MNQRVVYHPGLDLLKFILAILIISAHCQLFIEFPIVRGRWSSFTAIAVPLFFGISSYLFFRKIFDVARDSDTKSLLIHSIKRLSILFLSWYVLMIPMTYFRFYSVATLKETIFAIFLSCCFNGYWFIKALIINTAILYFCRGKKTLILCSTIALSIYLYCAYNYIYHYNPFLESLHPYYSFYYHTAYFCCGALFARYQNQLQFWKWRSDLLIILWVILYFFTLNSFFDPIYRLVSFVFLFPVFFKQKAFFSESVYKRLRNMSIILYMVQFVLIWLYNGACELWLNSSSIGYGVLQFSIVRFLLILIATVFIAWAVLTLEKKNCFAFLRYLH